MVYNCLLDTKIKNSLQNAKFCKLHSRLNSRLFIRPYNHGDSYKEKGGEEYCIEVQAVETHGY